MNELYHKGFRIALTIRPIVMPNVHNAHVLTRSHVYVGGCISVMLYAMNK